MDTYPGLRKWEHLMHQAVDATRCGSEVRAECLYREALSIAQRALESTTDALASADDRVAAYVVTHLNLAELLVDADQCNDAIAGLCVAHRRLMALLRDPSAGPSMQLAACRHSRETHAALLSHLTGPESHPSIVAALHAGCLPFPVSAGVTVH